MKTKITLIILLLTAFGYAQTGINYKAVIKDDLGNVVALANIPVQFTILEGATIIYRETHPATSDDNGIIILDIGEGTPVSGNFATIDWENGNQSLNVQVDIGDGFEDMGTTEFKAVPYALSSGDKAWETEADNVHVLSKNVGIGTDAATELLHIYDEDKVGINLNVPQYNDESQIEFKNGLETGIYSFFKLSNRNDNFRIELDTDLSPDVGYVQKLRVTNSGLSLENGASINEFSTDVTLEGNSNNAVPTEGAVKTYVDNAISTSHTISIPAYSMAIPPTSTIITKDALGLRWENNFSSSAKIAIKKPSNYNGGNVEFSIFYHVLTSSSGIVQFFIRPRSFNTTNQLEDATANASSGIFVSASSGSGIVYEQIITIPANMLTNDWWYIKIQRNTGSFTGDVTVMSAALHY